MGMRVLMGALGWKHLLLTAAISMAATLAAAQETSVTYTVDQAYDDVTFGLESAITDRVDQSCRRHAGTHERRRRLGRHDL